MSTNGHRNGLSEVTQWDAVHLLGDFEIPIDEAVQRGRGYLASLEILTRVSGSQVEHHPTKPFIDGRGVRYNLSVSEIARTYLGYASARRGVSYAGEPPAPSIPRSRDSEPFDTLP